MPYLFDKEKLEETLERKCVKKSSLCNKLNISPATLNRKINGYSEWTLSDLRILHNDLLSEQEIMTIFFD